MSKLLVKAILIKQSAPDTNIFVTELIDFTGNKGLDIKNNLLSFNLKNSQTNYDSQGVLQYNSVSNNTEILFAEDDTIKLYLLYSDDFAEIEAAVWGKNNLEPSSDYLIGVYNVTDQAVNETINSNSIKITAVDKTFIAFNRLLAEVFPLKATDGTTTSTTTDKLVDSSAKFLSDANVGMRVLNTTDATFTKIEAIDSDTQLTVSDDIFTSGEDYQLQWTAPSMIQKVIRQTTQSADGQYAGSGADAGVLYQIDAKLDVEGGFIQDARKNTYEDDTANTDLVFPGKSLAKVWKPVYEWLDELSQIEFLNSDDELNNVGGKKIVYGRKFFYYVDENNKFHWVETSDSVDDTVVVGTTPNIYKFSLKKSLFDVINFVVFRGGEDFYGKGTLDYVVDPAVSTKIKKMHVVAMTDIARDLIQREIDAGNLVENSAGTFTFVGVRYNRNGNVTAKWNNTTYSSDSTYNDALIDEITKLGKNRARSIIAGKANARWKGTIELRGDNYNQGNLLEVTNSKLGINAEKIRIMSVQNIINKDGWFTTLQLEQDDEVLISL